MKTIVQNRKRDHMKRYALQSPKQQAGEEGFVMVTAAVLLAVAAATVGSLLTASMTYQRVALSHHDREQAAFLADAGLQAALAKLNAYSEGNIASNQSRAYFAQTNRFTARDWGFVTQVTTTNGRNVLVSSGRYNGKTVRIQADISLGAGHRSIHALYEHALYAGNSSGDTNYVLKVGGTGTGADFVRGDVYSGGHIELSGDAKLRLPEDLWYDFDSDGIWDPVTDKWHNAYATQVFTNPLTEAEFSAYSNAMAPHMSKVYPNGRYDYGEAFVDTIGNGVYDPGEPFEDLNGNGSWDQADSFIDRNGNGVYDAGIDTVVDNGNGRWDPGEEWTEDSHPLRHGRRLNGRYDPAGGYWQLVSGSWQWKTARYKVNGVWYYPSTWPAEAFEDVGDGDYQPAEPFTDQNGVYDVGEKYLDDRNSLYDYGTQASGRITGMPAPGPGQRAATGGNPVVSPPDLAHMYYELDRNGMAPADALVRWGHDISVTASDYGNFLCITNQNNPEHIFVRNPPRSGSVTSRGKTIQGRQYTVISNEYGQRIDDYFLEDPTDPTYNSNPSQFRIASNDSSRTCTMMVDVQPQHNMLLYFVDGNVYIHNPAAYSMRFRQPGTRITIVARGNITISDEFYYNADYPPGLQYSNMNSTVVRNPQDALCLIALKNPACTNSGNILIGDAQFGTGGSIHAMLYAENDFIDNNINSVDQQFISIFGNMTAGNKIRLNRTVAPGQYRTRLDVTLDERIRDGRLIVPGLPHPLGGERSIQLDTAWRMVPGTWSSWSRLR